MRVLIVSHNEKEQVPAALASAVDWLRAQAIEFELLSSEHLVLSDPLLAQWAERVVDYDMVICLGGDGTILRVARMIGRSGVPLLSFNFGGMGFLAAEQASNMLLSLEAMLAGAYELDERTMLQVDVSYDDGSHDQQTALNELVASRGNSGRIVSLDLFINQTFMEKTRGDGVLVATATGSTAYALSAGGPIVNPHYDGLVVVPISPHTLKSWSLVSGPDDVVELRPSLENSQSVVLFLDGEVLWSSEAARLAGETSGYTEVGPEVLSAQVRPSGTGLKMVVPINHDFYGHIASTFFLSVLDR